MLSLTWNTQGQWYTLSNNNQVAWNFLSPTPEVTWHTAVIIIWILHSSLYLCIHGISLSSIHYSHSCHTYINQRHQYLCLIWSYNMNQSSLIFQASSAAKVKYCEQCRYFSCSHLAEYVKAQCQYSFGTKYIGTIFFFFFLRMLYSHRH